MTTESFNYTWGKNLIKFNSLSPNKDYYYRIQKPFDKYWGLFVAKIAFFDIDGELIYHNKNSYADPLTISSEDFIKYATYSIDGNFAYFRERGDDINQLNHLLIDLKNSRYKLVAWNEPEDKIRFKDFIAGNFYMDTMDMFDKVEWLKNKKDKLKMKSIFGIKKWHP